MNHRLTAVGMTKVDSTPCVRFKESFLMGLFLREPFIYVLAEFVR